MKEGKLVGVDKFGNKYYENPMYFLGKLLISCGVILWFLHIWFGLMLIILCVLRSRYLIIIVF